MQRGAIVVALRGLPWVVKSARLAENKIKMAFLECRMNTAIRACGLESSQSVEKLCIVIPVTGHDFHLPYLWRC
jgi:hypothetical protein